MNESMSDEGNYKTAPATPGLLKIIILQKLFKKQLKTNKSKCKVLENYFLKVQKFDYCLQKTTKKLLSKTIMKYFLAIQNHKIVS